MSQLTYSLFSTRYPQVFYAGLGTASLLVQVWLKCATANLNYSVGDKVLVAMANSLNSGGEGVTTIYVDSTNVTIATSLYLYLKNLSSHQDGGISSSFKN